MRITGVDVGTVEGLKIDGDHVAIKFSIGSNTIGTESRLSIKTDTILGRRCSRSSRGGPRCCGPRHVPLGQTTTPYQLYDANFDITKAATGWNIDTVKQSLNVLSQTVDQTYPHLSAALDGLAKFSDTIGKRDEQIRHLLAQANKVASVLGDRSEQIDRLLVNSKTLLAAINERRRAIEHAAGEHLRLLGAGAGVHHRQPEPRSGVRAGPCDQRRAGQTQGRPGSRSPNVSQFVASLSEIPSRRGSTSRSS